MRKLRYQTLNNLPKVMARKCQGWGLNLGLRHQSPGCARWGGRSLALRDKGEGWTTSRQDEQAMVL